MSNFNLRRLSPEQQKKVKDERDKKQRDEMLQAAIDKINQGIERNVSRSGERAIWELVQNARDLAINNQAVIKIVLDNDGLHFLHQGVPFTIDTLSNLIKQQSTKLNDKDAVGQYGTGFMTTHIFNRKVYICGDCKIDSGDDCIYVPLPEGFCLNRDFTDEESDAFRKELDSELNAVEDLRLSAGNDEAQPWTEFRYELTDYKKQKVSAQLDKVRSLMPFVMVLNERIQECTIIDKLKDKEFKFTQGMTIEVDNNFDNNNSKHFLNKVVMTSGECEEEIELHTLVSADKLDVVFIPPMPPMYSDMSQIPSEFLYFPLLGSENFGMNFIIHSNRMYPQETRDSYIWPIEGDSVTWKYKVNVQVLSDITNMLFAYYEGDVSRQAIPLQFAKVEFPINTEDEVSRQFYNDLQRKFSSKFSVWKMIPSKDGYQKIENNDSFGVLSKDIYEGLSDEQRSKYIPIVASYASMVKSLPSENIVGWSKIVNSWATESDQWFITLDNICGKILSKDNQLHDFLLLLKDMGSVGIKLLELYPLIPNRKGELRTKTLLLNGKDITDRLYQLVEPIIGQSADVIVDPLYADITELSPYTRKNLQTDLASAISVLRRSTLNKQPAVELEANKITDIISFCSVFTTQSPNSFRYNLMPIVCSLYGQNFKFEYIEPKDSTEDDMYLPAFDFLLEQTMLMISKKKAEWLNTDKDKDKHHSDLVNFVTLYIGEGRNKDRMEKLNSYSIFPNQLGEMCMAKELKRKGSDIDDALLKLYKELFEKDLKCIFVDEDFASLYNFEELTAKEIGNRMDEKLSEGHDDKLLLEVLSKFNEKDNKWYTFFPRVYSQREALYYSLGTVEDKKAMFALQMKGSEALQRMAKIAESSNFEEIMNHAEDMVEQQKEFERQFRFTSAIGVAIEKAVQKALGNDIKCISVNESKNLYADDVQNGQDIIISYNSEKLYYLECKAKWNFDNPAHMSSQQMKQAVREQKHYALVCIDCTRDTGCNVKPDATEEEVLAQTADILTHTHVHTDIGTLLNDTISPLVKREDEEQNEPDETTLKIYSSLTCNIPKSKFNSGMQYHDFINWLVDYLKRRL